MMTTPRTPTTAQSKINSYFPPAHSSPSHSHAPADTIATSSLSSTSLSSNNLLHTPPSPPEQNILKRQKQVDNEDIRASIVELTSAIKSLTTICTSNQSKIDNVLLISTNNANEIKSLSRKANDNETALQFLSTKSDQQQEATANLQQTNREMQQTIANLQQDIEHLRQNLAEEKSKRDNQEKVNRKSCLEISGIPQSTPENVDIRRRRVLDICEVLGVPMTALEIDDVHRKQNGEIIVLFSNRTSRDKLFNKRKSPQLQALSSSSFIDWPQLNRGRKLFINESLTTDRSKVAAICRRKAKQLNSQQNRSGDAAIRIGSSQGDLTVNKIINSQIRILKFSTVDEFDKFFPNSIEVQF